MTAYLVTGGAGFIGSHVTRRLAEDPSASVVVYDNLTSGRVEHLGDVLDEGRVRLVTGDLKDLEPLVAAMAGIDHVFHFAANPDIAKAMAEPSVDFWEGTFLTNNVLEAMRRAEVRRLDLRLGQRRLRRRRRAAGARGPAAVADLALRRLQARLRGA